MFVTVFRGNSRARVSPGERHASRTSTTCQPVGSTARSKDIARLVGAQNYMFDLYPESLELVQTTPWLQSV